MVFFNFLNFFAIFLEFSITRQVRTGRNETIIFIFSLSHPLSTNFGLKWCRNYIFFLFLEFYCYFFGIFHNASARNETKRKFLFSLFLGLFQTILALNDAIMVFLIFLIFLLFFCINYSAPVRNGMKRYDNFYFLPFSSSFNLFWLEIVP